MSLTKANTLKNRLENETLLEAVVFSPFHVRITSDETEVDVWISNKNRYTIMKKYKKSTKCYAYSYDQFIKRLFKFFPNAY